jgi:branched-chain amino acid transport system permease protein
MITYVGGVGTIVGPIVGAIFYVLVREWLAVSLVEVHLLIFGLLFVTVVLVLPGGLVEAWAKLRRLRLLPKQKATSVTRPNGVA